MGVRGSAAPSRGGRGRRASRSRAPRVRRRDGRAAGADRGSRAARPAGRAAGLARRALLGDLARPGVARLRQVVPRRRAGRFRGRIDHPPDLVARPTGERGAGGAPRLVRRVPTSPRSRSAAARASSAASSRPSGGAYAGAVSIDLRRLDRVLEVDHVSQAARIQAGATGPALEAGAPRRGAHAPPLPAVVRALDARRLDRDARRRPLRHAPHAHRRPRRVGACDYAVGRVGKPPPSWLGRRAEPGPAPARIRGHARGDHRGVDARAPAAAVQGLRGSAVWRASPRARRRSGRSPSQACGRRTVGCSTRARPR